MIPILRMACAALVLAAAPAAAQDDIRTEQVRFAPGASGATIQGSIKGYGSVSYLLGASAGQRMTVALTSTNTQTYFNVYAPGSGPGDASLGNSAGAPESPMVPDINRFDGTLPVSGTYTINVYMMRAAARRGETSNFTLDVAIGGTPAAPAPDYADGLAGGPDFWEVSVQTSLKVHSAPSTGTAVVAMLTPGTIVENRGCRMSEGRRWCEIADGDATGWVAGEYLVEAAQPNARPVPVPVPVPDAQVPGTPYHATGQVTCVLGERQRQETCDFGVIRKGGGLGTVVVTRPNGNMLTFEFGENGLTVDRDRNVSIERQGDMVIVQVGPHDRYHFFDAILYGG